MQCLLLECLWESIGLRRSFHNLGGQKKVKTWRRFAIFFRQLGLGWAQAGSATSKVKVLSRRNVSFFQNLLFCLHERLCFQMLCDQWGRHLSQNL